jgi:acetyl-CoA/propionyl-CoA carboxylase biotin carboxyl carrier protein
MTNDALTPREVAEELRVTVRTVQRWIASGRLPATRVGGRMRVARSALARVATGPALGAPTPSARRIVTLLIANRGEIAARVARTAAQLGIRSVGVHAPDDRPPDGVDLALSVAGYLDAGSILDAARRSGADAVHPGYGFLAENPAFAGAVIDAGLAWVGPPPGAIEAAGDKAAARRLAAELDIPVVNGYDGRVQDDEALTAEGERIGFPLLIKPSAGGGGKGMRVVRDPDQLAAALSAARREARGAFGDDRLILERLVEGARHIEVQILFDAHGAGIHLGARDCSSQRRSQKIVEEAPAASVPDALRDRLGPAAVRLAAAVGYIGAGTVEFLVDEERYWFLEMNARLQVEHPVTEAVTGRDLVADQLRIAAGEPLGIAQSDVRWRGHAIEARVYAEDPDAGFLPAAGRLLRVRWPADLRVDTGVRAGDPISDRYDPMLAKLVAHGATRAEAVARLRAGLDHALVLGVRTNLRFLRWLLDQPAMRRGEMRTDTIAGLTLPPAAEPTEAAWLAAGRALLEAGPYGEWSGGWRSNAPAAVRLRFGDRERRVELSAHAGRVELVIEGGVAHVDADGQSLELTLAMPPSVEEAVRHAAAQTGATAELTAPMPGRVIAVRAAEGASLAAHATVVVIEAMKMEHAVTTPMPGRLARVHVRPGQQVQRGELLAEVTA